MMSARRAESAIKAPSFGVIKVVLMVIFTLTVLGETGKLRTSVVFLAFGLCHALRVSVTVFMLFAFQYIAELYTVLCRIQVRGF